MTELGQSVEGLQYNRFICFLILDRAIVIFLSKNLVVVGSRDVPDEDRCYAVACSIKSLNSVTNASSFGPGLYTSAALLSLKNTPPRTPGEGMPEQSCCR